MKSITLTLCLSLFATGINAANDNDGLPLGKYRAEVSKISTFSDNDCLKSFAQSFNEGLAVLDLGKEPVRLGDNTKPAEERENVTPLKAEDIQGSASLTPIIEMNCEFKRIGELPSDFKETAERISKGEVADCTVEITENAIVISNPSGEQSHKYTETRITNKGTMFMLADGGNAILEEHANSYLLKIKGFEYSMNKSRLK